MDILQLLRQGDAVTQAVAVLLLAMSVGSWVVILWKARLVRRAEADVAAATAAFWQAADLPQARGRLASIDRDGLVLPLVEATDTPAPGVLAAAGLRPGRARRPCRTDRWSAWPGSARRAGCPGHSRRGWSSCG